ncbi:MAG TPA: SDR family oxidoreductase [Bacteroidetes bacterium]|nr:SDR family oxidoreductase [Bacteroidota bacterium]
MSQHCLILGAKSDIARALAHVFAEAGFNLYLAGRNADSDLRPDAQDLAIRHSVQAQAIEFDALDYGRHAEMYAALTPKPAVVISVVGYMPDQEAAAQDGAMARRIMETNFVGCAHFLGIVAQDMETRKAGSIIGISSVAGDRGRAKNYLYGSAKAGFTAFLSGLRNRLHAAGVQVLTVKPGFVYTKMTEGMDLPAKLTASPEKVASDVFKAWKKGKNVLYTKWIWRWIMFIIRNIPEWQFKKMKI